MNELMEKVSRYRDGELSPEEMRAVEQEPGFTERLAHLQRLDDAVQALPQGTPGLDTETLLARVRRPERAPGSKKNFLVGLGILAAALLVLVLRLPSSSDAWSLISSGGALVDGQAVKPGLLPLVSGTVGAEQGAQLFRGEAWVGLPPGALARVSPEVLELLRGNVVASGATLSLQAAGSRVTVHGLAVLSMEPEAGVVRVTQALTQFPEGALMKNEWMKLSSVATTAAVAGVGLTLFVVRGNAEVQPEGAPMVEVKAGQQWRPARGGPPAAFALTAGPARAEATKDNAEAALSGQSTRPTSPALAAMNREQLVALVEKLSDEKETLLVQREGLKKKLEQSAAEPPRNYYHFTPEELNDSARKGQLRLRGPQLQGEDFKIQDKVADDLSLTPDERAKVLAIFQASTERARQGLLALYKEIGGDVDQAATLSSETILNEIRSKALTDDFAGAVRQLANERAGLAQPLAGGPPVYRAYRLFLLEDARVITELEQLLGPRRAEAFLNHEKTSHSDHTFGVGPAPEKK